MDPQAIEDKAFILGGDAGRMVQNPVADPVRGFARDFQVEKVLDHPQLYLSADQNAPIWLDLELFRGFVALVVDLAHHLLDDVLQGEDALQIAAVVHHQRHVLLMFAQEGEQLVDRLVGGDEEGLSAYFQGTDVRAAPDQGLQQVSGEQHLEDDVGVVAMQGYAGIGLLDDRRCQVLQGAAAVETEDPPPGGHDILGAQVVEAEDSFDHLALVGLDGPFLFAMFHHADEFRLGDHGVAILTDHPLNPIGQVGEEPDQGPDGAHEGVDDGTHHQGDTLGVAGRDALGGDLAKNEKQEGDDAHGDAGPQVSKPVGGDDGGEGGGAGIDQIVADQDGDQHGGWVFLEPINGCGAGTTFPLEGMGAG
jgi:hypothetical protein